jgi:NAD(P)-dependent dehydrogenase (short-subunit alcohol dehydrogenase family)
MENLMKILLIGANGTIGKLVKQNLAPRHEIIEVGKTSGQFQVDISNESNIRQLFAQVGKVDAIVVTAGDVHFGAMQEMTSDQFSLGLHSKLLGQVNITLIGQHYLNQGGSITLTSGSLSHNPTFGGSNFSTVNAAVDGFVKGAALELKQDRRINVVSPTVLEESWHIYGAAFPGLEAAPGAKVALAYQRSVEGFETGQEYRVW